MKIIHIELMLIATNNLKLKRVIFKKQYIELIDADKVNKANEKLIALSQISESFMLMDVNSKFIDGSKVMILNGYDILYYDDDHLSYQGSNELRQELFEEIKSLLISSQFIVEYE